MTSQLVDAQVYFGKHLQAAQGICRVSSGEELVGIMDEAGIRVAAIPPPDWYNTEDAETPPYAESTRAVLEAAEAFPDRLVPLVRVNPNWHVQSVSAFKEWARHPLCRGMKLHPQWDYFPVNSRELVDPLMAICEEHGLTALFSCGTYPAAQPMTFMNLATRWPKVKIGLVHAGLRMTHDAVIVAQRCPNIFLVCTPRVTASTIPTLIRLLGPERVVFGSEMPIESPTYAAQTIRSLPGIDDAVKNQLLGKNAAYWLGLSSAA